jgi:ribulose-5-phosphate 4-epimerase/fuculose-1-phosphate aldolase
MPSRSPAPPADEARLRDAVVAAGRRLGAHGLITAGEGNLSVRVHGDRLLITPSGRRKDELEPADLVIVPERAARGGHAASGGARPSSDIAIHRAIYAARPDVLAVTHAHLPAAMSLTLAGVVPDPSVLPETALLLPRLPFVPFAPAGSDELAESIGAALTDGRTPPGAVLLERHGAVAVGDAIGDGAVALAQAVDRLELVEVLCRAWRDALLVRAAATALGPGTILRPPATSPGTPARESNRRKG